MINKNEHIITYDLEKNPIQIKSDLTRTNLFPTTSERTGIGGISVKETTFFIASCANWATLTSTLPAADTDGNWILTLTKTETSVKIACEGVEVVNLVFSDVSLDCDARWANTETAYIWITEGNAYRKAPGKSI